MKDQCLTLKLESPFEQVIYSTPWSARNEAAINAR